MGVSVCYEANEAFYIPVGHKERTELKKASEIPQNKRRETLLSNKDKAMISKKLVTLKNDVPLKNDAADFIIKDINKDKR